MMGTDEYVLVDVTGEMRMGKDRGHFFPSMDAMKSDHPIHPGG